jgi:hypothetical protein
MKSLILQLSESSWLNARRAQAWCSVLAIMTALMTAGYLALSHQGIDPFGKPIGPDFISFWTASRFALSGHPGFAYQPNLHEAAEVALFPSAIPTYAAFFYPPTFLLLCLPLALLPYLAALALWLGAGLLGLTLCLRRILPQPWAILPMLAFPGVLLNFGHGQNGFVTACCFGWSMVLRRKYPFVAGLCLGLLVIKPHLLVAAPVALLAGRHWRMIAGGITSGLGLALLSWLVLGREAWEGFVQLSPLARATLEQGLVEPWKMQSVFTTIRLAHGSVALSYAAQSVIAVAVLFLLARTLRHDAAPEAEGALLVVATMLCTPFLLDYDFVSLALPIAWVMAQALRTGWLPWEKITLLAAYVLPLVARPVAMTTSLSIAPFIVAAMLAATIRRCRFPR